MKAGEYDLAGAAQAAKMDTAKLRFALGKSYVRRYMREQRQIEVEALCQGNPAALRKIRDEGENAMASVTAIRTAETMRQRMLEEDNAGASSRPLVPGLVIQIVGADRIEPPRVASAPRIEDGAFLRKPDPDDDLLAGDLDDHEALDALPEPARVAVRPARRK
jgi:hypothetical protein